MKPHLVTLEWAKANHTVLLAISLTDARTLPSLSGLRRSVAPNFRRDQWGNFRLCAEFSAFRGGVSPPFNNLWPNTTLARAGIWPALFAVDVKSDRHAAAIHERAVLRSVCRV